MCDSAVSPCLSVCPAFLHKRFPLGSPPSGHPAVTADLAPGLPPVSMLQPPAAALSRELVSLSRYTRLCDSHSIWTVTGQLLIQQPQMLHFCSKQLPRCGDLTPASGTDPVLLTLLFFPASFLCSTEFCIILYILFWWRGTPACSQLVFCKIFSVWRCIPDAFMDRDALHIHLLLCHLGSLQNCV